MEDQHLKGYIFSLIAAFSIAVMAAFVKLASDVSIFTLIFFRNVISLLILLPVIFQGKLSLKTSRPRLHFFRAVMGLSGIYCYFYSVQHLELTEGVVLSNTAPLYIPFVARVWLKTSLTKTRIFCVFLGFLGVLLILQPGYGLFYHPASLVGLLGAVCASIAFVSVKQLTRTEVTPKILFYYFTYCIGFSFFPMLFSTSPKPTAITWLYIFLVGISAISYQFFMTRSYACLSATKVASLLYLAVIFGAILDWFVWGHHFSSLELVGSALIIGGGVFSLLDGNVPLRLGKRPPT